MGGVTATEKQHTGAAPQPNIAPSEISLSIRLCKNPDSKSSEGSCKISNVTTHRPVSLLSSRAAPHSPENKSKKPASLGGHCSFVPRKI
jgi:hypothetical protein